MEPIIVLIIAFCVCAVYIFFSGKKNNDTKHLYKRSRKLYYSCNKNSYENARDVFKTLRNAGVKINFTGEDNE